MASEDWQAEFAKSLGVFLNGDALPDSDQRGRPLGDDTFLLLSNAHHADVEFVLPGRTWGDLWVQEINSATGGLRGTQPLTAGAAIAVAARSVAVLRRC